MIFSSCQAKVIAHIKDKIKNEDCDALAAPQGASEPDGVAALPVTRCPQ
jgi:hypothetical protein